jgi:hypothetical protein
MSIWVGRRMLVKVASLLPLVDASSEEMGQALP